MPIFVIPDSFGTSPLREENLCHEPGGRPSGGQFAKKNSGVCAVTPSGKVHKKPKGENVTTLENFASPETVALVLGAGVDVAEVAKGMVADVEWDQPFNISIKSHGGPFDDRMPGYFIHNIQGQYDLRRNLEYRFRNEASLDEQAQPLAFQKWVRNTPEFKDWAEKNYKSFGMDPPSVVISLATPGDEITAMRVFRRMTQRDLDGHESSYLKVDHHYLEANDAAPSGLAKQLFRGSIEEYERLGVERITTHANIDVGGYAWGRYGFAPTDPAEVLAILRDKISMAKRNPEVVYGDKVWDAGRKTRVGRIVRTTLTPKTITALEKLADRIQNASTADAKGPFWAAIDAHVPGRAHEAMDPFGTSAKFSIGKWLMLDTDWEASLNLKDPAQVTRLRRYLYGKTA
jgi:hypothetical protein